MTRHCENAETVDSSSECSADRGLLPNYVRGRDETAFRALVERHLDFVYSAAMGTALPTSVTRTPPLPTWSPQPETFAVIGVGSLVTAVVRVALTGIVL